MASRPLRVERAELAVDLGGGALDDAECTNQRQRHSLVADPEIFDASARSARPNARRRKSRSAPKVSLSVRVCLEALRGGEAMLLNAGRRALGPKSLTLLFAEAIQPHDLCSAGGFWRFLRLAALAGVGTGGHCGHRRLRSRRRRTLLRLSGRLGRFRCLRPARRCPGLPPSVSNCRPNCTDGSKKPLIASNGTRHPLRDAAERQADFEIRRR